MIGRPEQVPRAVAIINPKPERRAECKEEIRYALDEISLQANQLRWGYLERTKKGKKAAEQLHAALRRVQNVLKNSFEKDSKGRVLLTSEGCVLPLLDLPLWWHMIPPDDLAEWIELARQAATEKGKTLRLDAEKKRAAVRAAIGLVIEFGEKERLAANKSKLPKLAAVLYGEPRANLQSQCRAALRKKRGAK